MTTRKSTDQWQKLIDTQIQGKQSVAEFCQSNQITQSNFYHWRKKLKEDKQALSDQDWLSINPDEAPNHDTSSWIIELTLPGGVTLKMKALD